jgi:membrane-associated phospholipid phosphatase
MTVERVPGQHQFGPAVERFDELVDSALDRVRGNPIADRVFTSASHVGDFSLIWHVIGICRGIARRNPRQVVLLAVLLGAESLIVNQGIKRLFKRTRPTPSGDTGLHVRQPSTSSFPSGHASSATFASSILASWDGPRLGRLWYLIASIVGTSRAYVRIHHASDVVAGIITGRALAWIAQHGLRRALRRFGIDRLL